MCEVMTEVECVNGDRKIVALVEVIDQMLECDRHAETFMRLSIVIIILMLGFIMYLFAAVHNLNERCVDYKNRIAIIEEYLDLGE